MDNKLVDSELKIMNVLWNEGDCSARYIAGILTNEYGWNINTTYELINKIYDGCIEKIICCIVGKKEIVGRTDRTTETDR